MSTAALLEKPLFPVFLNLAGKAVLLAGAGQVAVEKLRTLLPCGAVVEVLAPEANEAFHALLQEYPQQLFWQQRAIDPVADIERLKPVFVMAATNDVQVNARLIQAARERQLWANAVDNPPLCDFYTAATVDTGPIRLAISSEGRYPGLVAAVRKVLQVVLPQEDADTLTQLSSQRERLKQLLQNPHKRSKALKGIARKIEQAYFGLTP